MRRSIAAATCVPVLFACGPTQFHEPMADASRRVKPLHFGLHVTPDPDENPIDPPERFTGFHAATDFEVSSDELDVDVAVHAICTGKIAYSGYAEGYGGLIVQRCSHGGPITVLYGHLDLASLPREGEKYTGGEKMALLAHADSYDSGFTRKHLHLGIHRGKNLDLRGYVQSEEELAAYIDPMTVLPLGIADPLLPEIRPYWEKE